MPVSIPTMVRRMHAYRDEIEGATGPLGEAAIDLERIFARAEVALARIMRRHLRTLETGEAGALAKTPENIEAAGRIVERMQVDIEKWLVGPGKAWAKKTVPIAHGAGRELARINLDVRFVSGEMMAAAFRNVTADERAILKVGFESTYEIMGTVGNDVATWFRRTMADSILEGIPVQGAGDTLANRLMDSGRIKPLTIRAKTGRIIHRSLRQRANAIARVESARIVNKTHETLAETALGTEAVYVNSNPQDDRTTDICARASRSAPKTLRQWDNSSFGRPPRLNPFHLCRSVLIGGQREWFNAA